MSLNQFVSAFIVRATTTTIAEETPAEGGTGGEIQQPTARPLPGDAQTLIDDVLGWMVTIAGVVAVGAFIFIGIRLMLGFRRNGQVAADALGGLPWVFGGAILVTLAAELTNRVL